MAIPEPEPWLRGPIPGVHPLLTPILYAFTQAREDLAYHTAALGTAQLWSTPHGFASVGFHLRHIAGSVDRLMTYLDQRQLTAEQRLALATEPDPGASREELLAGLDAAFHRAETAVRALDPAALAAPRTVGRQRLPSTVIGLLTHIAEHTQRHTGQAIAAARLAAVIDGVISSNRP
jgi:uncharacterized damage-inducible protein DinB